MSAYNPIFEPTPGATRNSEENEFVVMENEGWNDGLYGPMGFGGDGVSVNKGVKDMD